MEKFHGTIAVVAGASTGIGLGIVKKLLETRELEVVGFSRREMELSNPNFRKANLLFFSSSISLSNSSGGFSWCLPWPPWAPKYSLVRHFCMLTCLVTNCWISFLKICLDLALSLVVSWKNLMDSCLIFSSDTLPLRRQSSYQAKVSPFDRGILAEMRLSLKRSRARLDKGKRPSKVQNIERRGCQRTDLLLEWSPGVSLL